MEAYRFFEPGFSRVILRGILLLCLGGVSVLGADDEDWPANESNSVSIYNDGEADLFGRSRYRSVRSTILDTVYGRRDSFDVARVIGGVDEYQTAVVLSSEVRRRLVSLFEEGASAETEGGYRFEWKQEAGVKVFSVSHPDMGLDLAFSLDRPPKEMLQMIRDVYGRNEVWRRWTQPVLDHYRSHYVITVHRGENIFRPWEEEISYAEALAAATLLGDREQWLWGIHDGRGLLRTALMGRSGAE